MKIHHVCVKVGYNKLSLYLVGNNLYGAFLWVFALNIIGLRGF